MAQMVEFKSPSGRLVLSVEGRGDLHENDITWLRFLAENVRTVNTRIADAGTADRPASEKER